MQSNLSYLFLMHLSSAKTIQNELLFSPRNRQWQGWQQLCVACSAFLFLARFFLCGSVVACSGAVPIINVFFKDFCYYVFVA
jgi:hypothetical protein